MSRFRVNPVKGDKLSVDMPGGAWSGIVASLAVLAAGGGVVERLPPQAAALVSSLAVRLGHVAIDEGEGRLRLEYVSDRAGGEYSVNVGCSLDYATLVGIVSGVVAPPGARIVLRGCEELVEADWRPLIEAVAAYGGRAYPAGSPKSLVVIEAVGRGRLRTGLWRLEVRSSSTVAHIAGAIIAALAAEDSVYIRVWPRDPHSKSDIDPAVYAASIVGEVEYSPGYNRFRVKPGSPGARVINRPDTALSLHMAGLSAAGGVRVSLRAWRVEPRTVYDPLSTASTLLEQLGYLHEAREDTLVVEDIGAQVRRLFWLRDYPEYAAPIVTLAAARRGEARLEELPEQHIREAGDVATVFLPLGYSVETSPEALSVKPGAEPLTLEELAATCTSPHVLPAAVVAATLASRPYMVDRGDCLRLLWPEFYKALGEANVLARL